MHGRTEEEKGIKENSQLLVFVHVGCRCRLMDVGGGGRNLFCFSTSVQCCVPYPPTTLL